MSPGERRTWWLGALLMFVLWMLIVGVIYVVLTG